MTRFDIAAGPAQGYTLLQIGLHWLIAALVIGQLIFGENMTEAIEAAEDGETIPMLVARLADLHYYVGIAILALVAVRLVVRLRNGVPPPPETTGPLAWAGRVSHWAFYALLVAVPVTGLLGVYQGDPYGIWHAYAKPVFIGLIALHVTASLYHHFWRKDGLLMRMIRPAT